MTIRAVGGRGCRQPGVPNCDTPFNHEHPVDDQSVHSDEVMRPDFPALAKTLNGIKTAQVGRLSGRRSSGSSDGRRFRCHGSLNTTGRLCRGYDGLLPFAIVMSRELPLTGSLMPAGRLLAMGGVYQPASRRVCATTSPGYPATAYPDFLLDDWVDAVMASTAKGCYYHVMAERNNSVSILRIRVGLIIWVCSFLPLPSIALHTLHDQGKFTTAQQSSTFLAVCYSLQFLLGFIGLIIAGSAAAGLVKSAGWRKIPAVLWRVVIHGQVTDDSNGTKAPKNPAGQTGL